MRKGKDYYHAVDEIGKIESITPSAIAHQKAKLLKAEDVPNVANPIVQKALYEVRRVANSIIKRYGKPAIIRIEMAREMKSSKNHRREIARQQEENRKRNEEAEKEIVKFARMEDSIVSLQTFGNGMRVKRADRNKFKMWKYEQNERCPYCQKHIGFNQLFSGEADIEHILPYTGFRQSYMNTLVSCRPCNQNKSQRTPFDAWGTNLERWDRIEEFAKENYNHQLSQKRRNVLKKNHQPENMEDFVQRQLNDTRYIATATKKMLEQFGVPVDVNNGAATSELRHLLGLNRVLPSDPASGVYTETGEKIDNDTGEILIFDATKAAKSRQDHRHHAVDAFVVAMTDRAMLKAMVDVHKKKQDQRYRQNHKTKEDWIKQKRLVLPETWQDGDALHNILSRKLNATVVSHMAKHKIWGPLHGATRYRKSYFNQKLDIEGIRSSTLRHIMRMAETAAYGGRDWIADENLRSTLLQWASEMFGRPASDRCLPHYKGKYLKEIVYQTPCMTTRKEIDGKLLTKLTKEWLPGKKKTWIAEKSIHDMLYKWMVENNLVGKEEKDINVCLKRSPPPCLPNKHGKPVPIYRTRVAEARSDSHVAIAGAYVKTDSNHHFVLFHNGKEGKQRKRKIQMVTMLEAARRVSVGESVINKVPKPEWEVEGDWYYELHLCTNDMVRCLDMSVFEDDEKFAPQHRETPYFRVQSISSGGEDKIDMELRHHSISGTDSDWGKWRISKLANMSLEKVQIGNLGLLPDDS